MEAIGRALLKAPTHPLHMLLLIKDLRATVGQLGQ
jgi:hypothetical protein